MSAIGKLGGYIFGLFEVGVLRPKVISGYRLVMVHTQVGVILMPTWETRSPAR